MHNWELDDPKEAQQYSLTHNPGYDFRRIVRRLAKQPKRAIPRSDAHRPCNYVPLPLRYIPVITLISACCAIEAYLDMAGRMLNPKEWNVLCRGPIPIRKRIEAVFSYKDKAPDFSSGIYHDITELFAARIKLVHPKYVNSQRRGKSSIPTIFQEIGKKYPPSKTSEITELAIKSLLSDIDLKDYENLWRAEGLNMEY